MLSMKKMVVCVPVLLMLFCLPAANAEVWIDGWPGAEGYDSTEGQGLFYGILEYSATSDTEAQLTVTLFNFSDPANGGYITGFALNNPGDRIEEVYAADDFPANFQLLNTKMKPDAVKCVPYGLFDFGAALGGNFLGGGSPLGGIPTGVEGATQVFTFILFGHDMDQMNEWSFVAELSKAKGGEGTSFFVVRFKGFEDDSSDKTLAGIYFGWGE